MTFRRLASACALLALLPGCLPAGLPLTPGTEERHLEIVRVEAPADARVGEPVAVKLTARLYGACWGVGRVEAIADGQSRRVTVAGLAVPRPGPCDEAVREEAVTVSFTPPNAGTYAVEVPFGTDRARQARTIRVLD